MEVTLQQAFEYLVGSLVPGSIYATVALGIALIYRGTGVVNFAQGEALALGAFFSFVTIRAFSVSLLVVIPLLLVAGAIVGAVLERGIFRRLMESSEMEMVIGTLGVSIVIRGVLRARYGSEAYALPMISQASPVHIFGVSVTIHGLVIIGFGVLLAIGGWWIVQRTRAGLAMQMTAADQEVAGILGLDVRRVFAGVWSGSYALSFVAGGLVGPLIFVWPNMGLGPLIKGLAGAILGGFGSLPGAIVGAYIVSFFETAASGILSSAYRDTYAFVIIFIVLAIRPSGLFGTEVEKRV